VRHEANSSDGNRVRQVLPAWFGGLSFGMDQTHRLNLRHKKKPKARLSILRAGLFSLLVFQAFDRSWTGGTTGAWFDRKGQLKPLPWSPVLLAAGYGVFESRDFSRASSHRITK